MNDGETAKLKIPHPEGRTLHLEVSWNFFPSHFQWNFDCLQSETSLHCTGVGWAHLHHNPCTNHLEYLERNHSRVNWVLANIKKGESQIHELLDRSGSTQYCTICNTCTKPRIRRTLLGVTGHVTKAWPKHDILGLQDKCWLMSWPGRNPRTEKDAPWFLPVKARMGTFQKKNFRSSYSDEWRYRVHRSVSVPTRYEKDMGTTSN